MKNSIKRLMKKVADGNARAVKVWEDRAEYRENRKTRLKALILKNKENNDKTRNI
jgi:hypothetical protein